MEKTDLSPSIKIVRVKNCPGKHLHMQQVQVFDMAGSNVARQGTASQSTTGWDGDASRTIDGDTNPDAKWPNACHTQSGPNEFWQVELPAPTLVTRIIVFNRADCCQDRLEGACLQALDDFGGVLAEFTLSGDRSQDFFLAAATADETDRNSSSIQPTDADPPAAIIAEEEVLLAAAATADETDRNSSSNKQLSDTDPPAAVSEEEVAEGEKAVIVIVYPSAALRAVNPHIFTFGDALCVRLCPEDTLAQLRRKLYHQLNTELNMPSELRGQFNSWPLQWSGNSYGATSPQLLEDDSAPLAALPTRAMVYLLLPPVVWERHFSTTGCRCPLLPNTRVDLRKRPASDPRALPWVVRSYDAASGTYCVQAVGGKEQVTVHPCDLESSFNTALAVCVEVAPGVHNYCDIPWNTTVENVLLHQMRRWPHGSCQLSEEPASAAVLQQVLALPGAADAVNLQIIAPVHHESRWYTEEDDCTYGSCCFRCQCLGRTLAGTMSYDEGYGLCNENRLAIGDTLLHMLLRTSIEHNLHHAEHWKLLAPYRPDLTLTNVFGQAAAQLVCKTERKAIYRTHYHPPAQWFEELGGVPEGHGIEQYGGLTVDVFPEEAILRSSNLQQAPVDQGRLCQMQDIPWQAEVSNEHQFYHMDTGSIQTITGVAFRAPTTAPPTVTAFRVTTSKYWQTWDAANDGRAFDVANTGGGGGLVEVRFDAPAEARFVRLHPVAWEGSIAAHVGVILRGSAHPHGRPLAAEEVPRFMYVDENGEQGEAAGWAEYNEKRQDWREDKYDKLDVMMNYYVGDFDGHWTDQPTPPQQRLNCLSELARDGSAGAVYLLLHFTKQAHARVAHGVDAGFGRTRYKFASPRQAARFRLAAWQAWAACERVAPAAGREPALAQYIPREEFFELLSEPPPPPQRSDGTKTQHSDVLIARTEGARPFYEEGMGYNNAWDCEGSTYYDYKHADGGWTTGHFAEQAVSLIKYQPRQGFQQRMIGGSFSGIGANGVVTPLATINSIPQAGWNELQVAAEAGPFIAIRYDAPTGAYGNVAAIKLLGPELPAASELGWSETKAAALQALVQAGLTDTPMTSAFDAAEAMEAKLRDMLDAVLPLLLPAQPPTIRRAAAGVLMRAPRWTYDRWQRLPEKAEYPQNPLSHLWQQGFNLTLLQDADAEVSRCMLAIVANGKWQVGQPPKNAQRSPQYFASPRVPDGALTAVLVDIVRTHADAGVRQATLQVVMDVWAADVRYWQSSRADEWSVNNEAWHVRSDAVQLLMEVDAELALAVLRQQPVLDELLLADDEPALLLLRVATLMAELMKREDYPHPTDDTAQGHILHILARMYWGTGYPAGSSWPQEWYSPLGSGDSDLVGYGAVSDEEVREYRTALPPWYREEGEGHLDGMLPSWCAQYAAAAAGRRDDAAAVRLRLLQLLRRLGPEVACVRGGALLSAVRGCLHDREAAVRAAAAAAVAGITGQEPAEVCYKPLRFCWRSSNDYSAAHVDGVAEHFVGCTATAAPPGAGVGGF